MKLRTRKFWNILPLACLYWNLQDKARRHKRMPEYYSKAERNETVQRRFAKMLKYLGIELDVKGFDNVPNTSCLIIPNHSTYLDALIMDVALYNRGNKEAKSKTVNFIANSAVQDKKGVALVASLIDTFYLDMKKPREMVNTLYEFGKFVKINNSCGVIFAEGTRTKTGKLNDFKAGAFKIAQDCYLPIVPVTINNAANALDNNREGKLKIEVIFHPVLKPQSFSAISSSDLASQVQNIIASSYVDQVITSKETIKNTYTKSAHKK
ncbi:lysophospholipid acyltransferase family protein [[Mycoplasma] anseris]|uniref:1-acyl-sn-glycerol-3-phosphate acyltransferase n=1 Tax=[Mycoplasma] anseris TaxID=92400 RepID=A0A2Z4NCT3_9BACT|nr:lysophospholipid acyltransferase family protein [[Mycoplasma] anseris]AWX69378.1 1-acyl-sn-glycerol-3-phosphate acyltransferase [[Mycoplasma] anseris]